MSGGNVIALRKDAPHRRHRVHLADSAVETLVGQIKALIDTRNLGVGDALPSERELCEMFSSSRNTVREAMRILKTYGVVDVRPKVGAVIIDRRMDAVFDLYSFNTLELSRADLPRYPGLPVADRSGCGRRRCSSMRPPRTSPNFAASTMRCGEDAIARKAGAACDFALPRRAGRHHRQPADPRHLPDHEAGDAEDHGERHHRRKFGWRELRRTRRRSSTRSKRATALPTSTAMSRHLEAGLALFKEADATATDELAWRRATGPSAAGRGMASVTGGWTTPTATLSVEFTGRRQ